MIDFSTLQGLTIPEGIVAEIKDASGRVLWMAYGNKVVLQVEKITSNTYAGETLYKNEEFILLDIYPKANGTVNITYGGLTKTITDISGAETPNAQQVFFGTFNGVSDSVTTPASGELVIEGDYVAFGCSQYKQDSKDIISPFCFCVTAIDSFGMVGYIPDNAFGGLSGCNITQVKIPGCVKRIGSSAFENCLDLEKVVIANGVESVGSRAFLSILQDSVLTDINIPNSMVHIGDAAFSNRNGLTRMVIPARVTSIGENPWSGCNNITMAVDAGNSVYKFDGNCLIEIATQTIIAGFANAIIPSSIVTIGKYAFFDCTGLTNITIPNSVTSLEIYAFAGCTGLTNITIPNSVTSIGEYAFFDCTGLTNITIPNSVTSIGEYTFRLCESLTSITIPNSVTNIGAFAFINCKALSSVTLAEGLQTIGKKAFSLCPITKISIPATVEHIGDDALSNNPMHVYMNGTIPPTLDGTPFATNTSLLSIHVPKGYGEIYKAAEGWSTYASYITEEA